MCGVKFCFYRKHVLFIVCLIVLLCFSFWVTASAQNAAPVSTVTPAPTKTPAQEIDLKESLEKSLAAEQEASKQLEEQLKRAQRFEKDIDTEFNAYKIQISAYNSLLLVPDTPVEELEKVRGNTRTAVERIATRLKEFTQERNTLEQARLKTEEQYTLNQKQLNEIKTDSSKKAKSDPETKVLLEKLQSLTNVLSEKQEILEKIQSIYTELIGKLEEIQRDFSTLSEKFNTQIEERKRQELFERKPTPFAFLAKEQVSKEFDRLVEQGQLLLSIQFWVEMVQTLWETERFILVRVVLFLAIAIFLLLRFRRFFSDLVNKISCEQFPWRCLMVLLIEHSLLLSGATVFLYLYEQIRMLYSTVTLAQVFVRILMVFLFTRWMLDFLKLWVQKRGESNPALLVFYLRLLILVSRYFMIFYVIIEWALGSSSAILLLGRVVFEIWLFIWSILFSKTFRNTSEQIFPGTLHTRQTCRSLTIGLGYIISSGGLLIELGGYGPLARYWYGSWGQTAVVLLWAALVFIVLREWDKHFQKSSTVEQEESRNTSHQLRWLVVRLCWIVWPVALIAGLLVAWGAKQFVLVGVLNLLTYPVPVGGLNLSLLGIIYAICILLLTHVATRFWRRALKEKILVNSGLEMGVQASITTISVYLFWLFGILWALNSLGVSATSLTVAFGALGIGLGFGLQSIFNNFISGLILLFDRSIEVGDVMEINGKWGFIEQINVRSTIVRTYDNSALIIPNSEILSTQLTNWTLRDIRVRRTIKIGVAYGSDVRLVEQLLYEIAEKHARVLQEPAPMVLFTDFGESSLDFMLRVWTLLDYGVTTENDIRYEIDKVFREHHIEIPFPQRDLHIRSMPENMFHQQNAAHGETNQDQDIHDM